jgi:hypothetical protein
MRWSRWKIRDDRLLMMVQMGERPGSRKRKKNRTAQQAQTFCSHILSPYSVFWQVKGIVPFRHG